MHGSKNIKKWIWGSHIRITESLGVVGCDAVSFDVWFSAFQRHFFLKNV